MVCGGALSWTKESPVVNHYVETKKMKIGFDGKTINNCNECVRRTHKLPYGYVCTEMKDKAAQDTGFPLWCPLPDKQDEPTKGLSAEKYENLTERISDLIDCDAPENDILDAVLVELGLKSTTPTLPPQPWLPKDTDRVTDNEGETLVVCRYYDEDFVPVIIRLIIAVPRLLDVCERLVGWSGEKMEVLDTIRADAKDVIEDISTEDAGE